LLSRIAILQIFYRLSRSNLIMRPNYVQDHILPKRDTISCDSAITPPGGHMPYPSGHRERVKSRIVLSARRLFNRHGFDNVSLRQIMAGAGLTHGGFYSYFKSKSDLYSEVLSCFFTDPNWSNRWEGVEVDLHSSDAGPQVVRAYLSRQHLEDVENSCPMVALPSDVARSGKNAKAAFETAFEAMVQVLQRNLGGNDLSAHATAQAIAALCVGGMVVSRALVNSTLAHDLCDSCIDVALSLGGWQKQNPARSKPAVGKPAPRSA
jgi:TetR/AcrR family transcriptional regulator, transcriptional repressor for nem operon